MFTTKEEKKAADEITNSSNVIGKGTVLEGNIETAGNIRIEGRIIGNIKSKSKIALGILRADVSINMTRIAQCYFRF